MDEEFNGKVRLSEGSGLKNVTEDRWTKRGFPASSLLKQQQKKSIWWYLLENNRGIPDGEKGEDKNRKGRGISRQLGFGTDVDMGAGEDLNGSEKTQVSWVGEKYSWNFST